MTASALDFRRRRAEELSASRGLERRAFAADELEVRSTGNGWTLRGYASLFDSPYEIGSYVERIARGAFRRTLNDEPDVSLLLNHGGLPLARTKSGTLTLSEDHRGLRVEAQLDPQDPDAQTLKRKLQRGDLDGQMSFAFCPVDQDWSADFTERTLRAVNINRGDVSIVTQGANAATTAEVRSAFSDSELAELGEKGEAFANPDGHWSYPTPDVPHLAKAIKAVGRGPARLHNAIRRYLVARAEALNATHLIPDAWSREGHLLDRSAEGECSRCEGAGEITLTCPTCRGSGVYGLGEESEGEGEPVEPVGSVAADGRSVTIDAAQLARERQFKELRISAIVDAHEREKETVRTLPRRLANGRLVS